MLIVLFLIGLAFLLWGLIAVFKKDECLESYLLQIIVGVIIIVGTLIGVLVTVSDLNKVDRVIPGKIAYLEENNAIIETKLMAVVLEYQAYEKEAYTAFKPESGADVTVAISMFPELKSDVAVVSLLETYTSNNDAIRALELERLNRPTYTFWLYFGK